MIVGPKSKDSVFLDFGHKIFGGLNQKSETIKICEIYIYIDSQNAKPIRWKNEGGVGFLVIAIEKNCVFILMFVRGFV